jgi:hypothetical protein
MILKILDSPVPGETGFAPMKYAQHFMGQAFHGAGKPGNDENLRVRQSNHKKSKMQH